MDSTLYINLFGGPGCGKTVLACELFAALKKAGQTCELVPELVKELVWEGRLEELDNQHHIARLQYRSFKARQGKTRFVITDGPLGNALYYNRHYPHVCDIEKTEAQVLGWLGEFDHLNLFLTRGDFPYEQAGRYQSEAVAKQMDGALWATLSAHMPLKRLPAFPDVGALATEVLRVAASGPKMATQRFETHGPLRIPEPAAA